MRKVFATASLAIGLGSTSTGPAQAQFPGSTIGLPADLGSLGSNPPISQAAPPENRPAPSMRRVNREPWRNAVHRPWKRR